MRCTEPVRAVLPVPPLDESLERCVVCEARTFYIEKAINRALGLLLVVGAAVISAVIFYFNGIAALAFLIVFALVDFGAYHALPLRTVCYECLTEYQGWPLSERHRPFDHDIFEGIRQRRIRESEQVEASSDEAPLVTRGTSS